VFNTSYTSNGPERFSSEKFLPWKNKSSPTKDICIFVTEAEPSVSFSCGKQVEKNDNWVANFDQPPIPTKNKEDTNSNGNLLNSTSHSNTTTSGFPSGLMVVT
jgi:hypothetical protein